MANLGIGYVNQREEIAVNGTKLLERLSKNGGGSIKYPFFASEETKRGLGSKVSLSLKFNREKIISCIPAILDGHT